MKIEEMSTEEYEKELSSKPVVILPVGATEAHGPHLPLGTDSYQPEKVAEMLAERIDGLIAPALKYGHHGLTRNMVGTVDIRMQTLNDLIFDILSALVRDGVEQIVVLSGHAGNTHMAVLKEAARDVVEKHDVKIMVLTDYEIAWQYAEEQGFEREDGHGGLIETSRILSISPYMVKEERGQGRSIDPEYMILSSPEVLFPDGFVGPAYEATAELGTEINEHVVDRLESLIRKNMEVR